MSITIFRKWFLCLSNHFYMLSLQDKLFYILVYVLLFVQLLSWVPVSSQAKPKSSTFNFPLFKYSWFQVHLSLTVLQHYYHKNTALFFFYTNSIFIKFQIFQDLLLDIQIQLHLLLKKQHRRKSLTIKNIITKHYLPL